MPNTLTKRFICLAVLTMFVVGGSQAQVLERTVDTQSKIHANAAASQKRVTSLAQQTADLLEWPEEAGDDSAPEGQASADQAWKPTAASCR